MPPGYGDGQNYFGSVVVDTNGSGDATSFQPFRNRENQYFPATATDIDLATPANSARRKRLLRV
jgi:hypothetical protein